MKTQADSIKLFRETFAGRQDIVPRHWTSAKTGRSGYSPLCCNEWHRPECQKGIKKYACATCAHAEYARVSDLLIDGHFKGKHIIGVYPLLEDMSCCFIAADFDNHTRDRTPLDDVLDFYEVCEAQDIPTYTLRSKSGLGYHVFIFFEPRVPAWKARRVTFALLQEAEIIGDEVTVSSFDRLFPNQDRLSGTGPGNLIALPFQGKAVRKGHTLLLNPASGFTETFSDQWDRLADIRKISESELDRLISEWKLSQSPEICQTADVSPCISDYPLSDFSRIAARCAFIAHCRNDAESLSEPDWYILLTISARCKDGLKLSHRLSEPYPLYSPEETDIKISQAMNKTGPYRCETIRRINGRYCGTCVYYGKIRSPIVLGWMTRKYELCYELTEKEKEMIRKYYDFYRSIDEGFRIPGTPAQKHFEAVCRGRRPAQNFHERLYLKYKKILSEQKHISYHCIAQSRYDTGVKESPAGTSENSPAIHCRERLCGLIWLPSTSNKPVALSNSPSFLWPCDLESKDGSIFSNCCPTAPTLANPSSRATSS